MRIVHAALLLAVSSCPAFAQRVPAIVIPGRPDVPIIINGIDASWSVVEGDFGLDRPRDVYATVIYRPFAIVAPYFGPASYPVRPQGPSYFPSTGKTPGYGRLEVIPPPDRPLPPPAPSYRRSWSSQSAPGGAVTEYPSYMPPPVRGGTTYRNQYDRNRYQGAPQDQANEPMQIKSGNEPTPIKPINEQPTNQQQPTNQPAPTKSGNGRK
jgi:hypothetical protein